MSRLEMTVKQFREQKGLSVKELAIKVGEKPMYINRLEQGKVLPDKATIICLAKGLEASPNRLMGLMPTLDENLVVYLNQHPHVIELIRVIASSKLGEEQIIQLKGLIEEDGIAYMLYAS